VVAGVQQPVELMDDIQLGRAVCRASPEIELDAVGIVKFHNVDVTRPCFRLPTLSGSVEIHWLEPTPWR
jgi:hypothetical protein